ncbi:MAG TPA: hypothetical protein VMT72_10830 [Pseudolabrys sp.]|nr:hypothetical protein [Pseudolabrys sp.]
MATETNTKLASARQIHAAMNLHAAGEQECAITLAAAAEGMLVEPDEPAFRQKVKDFAATLPEAEGSQKPNDFINWLKHGTYNGKKCDTATIDDIEAPVAIWRAITKFYAVYKAVTPDMEKWQQTMKQKLSAEKAAQANVINSADKAPAAKP